jgi:hypothetical protein
VSAAEVVYWIPLAFMTSIGGRWKERVGLLIPSTVAKQRIGQQEARAAAPSESGFCYVQRGNRKALEPLFEGPYRIVEVRDKTVLVDFGSCQQWVLRDRVKPYQDDSPKTVTPRKSRGRPRK